MDLLDVTPDTIQDLKQILNERQLDSTNLRITASMG